MKFAAAFKLFLRPLNTLPEQQFESELDEEFAFHIEQIEREVMECSPAISREEASHRAHARFGDIETFKKRCKRIAMEERIMMQRINAVLMVIVVLAVVGVSVQVAVTQKYNTHALLEISNQIAKMRIDSAPEARDHGLMSAEEATRIRIVPLRYAEAQQVKDTLSKAFGPGAPEPAKRNVSITTDVRTNSLIVSAEPIVWQEMVEAMKDLDLDAAGRSRTRGRDSAAADSQHDRSDSVHAERVRVLPIRHRNAHDVAEALRRALDATQDVSITPDDRTNSLIIWADPEIKDEIARAVSTLDVEDLSEEEK